MRVKIISSMLVDKVTLPAIFRKLCQSGIGVSALILLLAATSVSADSVAPSAQQMLKPGQDIADYNRLQFEHPYTLQRLTKNTYWVSVKFYSALFYVGKKGVLLFDPLGPWQAQQVLKAIATVTDLPVSALVYSHSHQDHISGANVILDAAKQRGVDLRIIATDRVNKQLRRFTKAGIPLANDVLRTPADKFKFEKLKVQVRSPDPHVHSLDSSIFYLPSEKVVSVVDIIEADELPFKKFGHAIDSKSYGAVLEEVLAMDWDFLNGGHYNIGTRQTVKDFQVYLSDVEAAVAQALKNSKSFFEYINRETPVVSWLLQRQQDVTKEAREMLRVKYGHLASFEYVVDSHIAVVYGQHGHHSEI